MSENISYDELSRIQVGGNDPKINNQDARVMYVSSEGSGFKRTSDLMLGNDGKDLDDAVFVSADEFLAAAQALFQEQQVKKIRMEKTGKKINPEKLAKIVEATRDACRIAVSPNAKVQNQDARLVSVKTPNMTSEKVVAGAFLGKNGIPLANGEYVKQEEVEFTVVKRKKVPVVSQEGVSVAGQEAVPTKIKLAKGLGTAAVAAGLVAILPFIMHANSVLWHHSGPQMQQFLHAVNLGLGKMVDFTYDGQGLWTTAKGLMMNADAPTASLIPSILTYGATAAGITKLVADIKNGVVTVKNTIAGKLKKEEEGGKSL